MRFGLLCGWLFVGSVAAASAQGPATTMGQQQQSIGANQSLMASLLAPTTGSPYQAVKVTKSVQKLADGTVITRETKGVFARDSEGRVREDLYMVHSGQMNGREHDSALESATVGDPVSRTMLLWTDPKTKMAMKMSLPNLGGLVPPPPAVPRPPRIGGLAAAGLPAAAPGLNTPMAVAKSESDDVRTEQLGQQSIEGVLVTGIRTTTTIPLGKIGNDRPITVVHEEWRSPELKILVKTLDTDPRTGEQTMELTQLVRTDPDKSLFEAPAGFKVLDMADMMKTLGELGKAK